jgi:hypothetical protein
MLPRLYAIALLTLCALTAATSFADHPAATDYGPSCERTVNITKVHLVPEQHATTLPVLKLREVATTVPTMDLKIDFREEKRIVLVTTLKPREEERVVTSTTMVPETHIDPCTHCQTITYKPVCLSKVVKVTVMDSVQEPREVIVKVPVLTPVESAVVVKQLTVDVTTVPAIATTYKAHIIPSTVTVPAPPQPILPPPCVQPGH